MPLFIQTLQESAPVEILQEDFGDTMDSFQGWAERKLKGYSVKEIDVLANKAKHVNSEVSKRATLERIENALSDARKELATTKDSDKQRELRVQIQVLSELKSKVNSFKVTDDHDDKTEKEDDHKINLDER